MAIRIFRAGWIVTDTISDIVALRANTSSGTRYDSAVDLSTGLSYQVPTGKKLYISYFTLIGSGANPLLIIGYGDTAVADSLTAPTNFVNLSLGGNTFAGVTTQTEVNMYTFVPIPALKYPCILNNNAAVGCGARLLGIAI